MEYTIKTVCNRLNVTVHTVRHYCDEGLVPNLRYDAHGNRLFDEQSIHWLDTALHLRHSGCSIPEIRHYFDLCLQGESGLEERIQILVDLQEQAQKDLALAKRRLDCITNKIQQCQDALAGKRKDDANPLNL